VAPAPAAPKPAPAVVAQKAAPGAPRPSLLPGAPVPTSGSKVAALAELQAKASIRPPAAPPAGVGVEAPRAPSAAPPAPATIARIAPVSRPAAAPPPPVPAPLQGMPVVEIGMPDLSIAPPPPPPAPPAPATPSVVLPAAAAAPIAAGIAEAVAGAMKPALAKAVDAKVAEIATRGPEYAAIAALSRDVIEQIAWEVVPELAEVIIRAELDRLVAERGERK